MVLSSPITSSDAERTTSVHQRRGSGASVRSGTGTSWGEGERKKRDSSVSYRCLKVAHSLRNATVPFRNARRGNRRRLRRRSGRGRSGGGGAGRAAQAVAERGGPLRRWRSGAGRSGGGGQREGHADLGAPAVAVVDLEALRHLRDQRQPEPEPWAVRARQHPAPLIGHLDDHALGLAAGAHLDGAGLVVVEVGVQD